MQAADALRALIEATLASSAAVVLVAALRNSMRRAVGSQASYWLWLIVPATMLATLLPAPVMPMSTAAFALPTNAMPTGALAAADRVFLWLGVWASGVIGTCTWLCWQQHRYLRALGTIRIDAEGKWRASNLHGGPALIGAWHPKLVLPGNFEQYYEAEEQVLVLAHETAHLRRRDTSANALAAALLCVFWFNPLIHWALSRFRFDQELACDATVLRNMPHARRTYAGAMLKTQLAGDAAVSRLPVGCHWLSDHPLKVRIEALKRPIPGRAPRVSGMLLAIALVMGGSYGAWAAQPAVAPEATTAAGFTGASRISATPRGGTLSAAVQPTAGVSRIDAQPIAGDVITYSGRVVDGQHIDTTGLVTVPDTDSTIRADAQRIASGAGLRIVNPEMLDGQTRGGVAFQNVPVERVLTNVAQSNGLIAEIRGDEVRFVPANPSAGPIQPPTQTVYARSLDPNRSSGNAR